MPGFLVIGHAPLVIAAAHTLRLPTMATEVSIVRAGALAAYGPDFREYGRRPRVTWLAFSKAACLAISPSRLSIGRRWRSI